MIIAHTEKGHKSLSGVSQLGAFPTNSIISLNESLFVSASQNPSRVRLFSEVKKKSFISVATKMTKDSLVLRIKRSIRLLLKRLLH